MNIQVPAYWPLVEGVHALEKRGVLWEFVKTIDIVIEWLLDDEPMLEEEPMPDMSLLWLSISMMGDVTVGRW